MNVLVSGLQCQLPGAIRPMHSCTLHADKSLPLLLGEHMLSQAVVPLCRS